MDIVKAIGNVDFEITYNCNLRCLHCYNPEPSGEDNLKLERILEIISEVKRTGFEELHVTGGEPCEHQNFTEIISHANDSGMRILLETNATNLPIHTLKKLKMVTVRASIEGPEQTHNVIRRTKEMNAYRTSVENLVSAKESGIPVQVTTSVNKINHNKLYQMVFGLANLGLTDIRLRLSMPASYAEYHWAILKLSRDDYQEVQRQIAQIKQDFPHISFNSETLDRKKPSIAPKFFIDPVGIVKPYPFIEHYVGDLRTDSVEEVLEKIKTVRYPEAEEQKLCAYLDELQKR